MRGDTHCSRWWALPGKTILMRRICPPPPQLATVKVGRPTSQGSQNGTMHRPRQAKPVLGAEPSAALRDQLLKEINDLTDGDDLALWAHRRIAAKSTLTSNDELAIEAAYRAVLEAPGGDLLSAKRRGAMAERGLARKRRRSFKPTGRAVVDRSDSLADPQGSATPKSKAHLAFVGAQPCLSADARPAMLII